MLYLLVIVLAGISIFLGLNGEEALFAIFKPLTTIAIIIIVLTQRAVYSGRLLILLVAALVACLLGDILLLDDARFVAGLSAFLVAHLLFVVFFTSLGEWSWNWIHLLLLALLGGGYFYYLLPHLGEFAIPVAVYSCVILLMAWQGIGLATKSLCEEKRLGGDSYLLGIGAVLFMFSDSIIALNKFVSPFDLSIVVILASYWLSLLLIVRGSYSIAQAGD